MKHASKLQETIIAGCSTDRSIYILDSRQKVPLTRMVMKLRTNAISWYLIIVF